MSESGALLLDLIEERLKQINMSEAVALKKAGLHKDTLRDLRRRRRSTLGLKTWTKLRNVIGPVGDETLDERSVAKIVEIVSDGDAAAYLGYGGIVEAGAFREVDQLSQRETLRIERYRDPRYERARQYAWEVRGDSMDAMDIKDGMWVVGLDVVDFTSHYGDLSDGLLVIAEASEAEGSRIELTIKELRIFADRYELRPRSNSTHKTYVIPRTEDVALYAAVRVIAIVTEVFRRFVT